MSSRPAGTDGSDAAYRMVIAERYQAMADLRALISRLFTGHVAMLIVKLLWLAIGLQHGIRYPTQIQIMAAAELVCVALFYRAKLGVAKESMPILKMFNLAQAALTGMQVLSAFLYHNSDDMPPGPGEPVSYSNLWIQASLNNGLPFSKDTLKKVMPGIELCLDLSLVAFLVLATFLTHKYITIKIEDKKQRAAGVTAERTDAAAVVAAAGDDDGDGDEDTARPTAAASARTRSRRRMA